MDARSTVSISVALTDIRLTRPRWPLISIQSPTFTGRSASRIRPETKLFTIDCSPKPMPTDSAPATIARLVVSRPATDIAVSAAAVMAA